MFPSRLRPPRSSVAQCNRPAGGKHGGGEKAIGFDQQGAGVAQMQTSDRSFGYELGLAVMQPHSDDAMLQVQTTNRDFEQTDNLAAIQRRSDGTSTHEIKGSVPVDIKSKVPSSDTSTRDDDSDSDSDVAVSDAYTDEDDSEGSAEPADVDVDEFSRRYTLPYPKLPQPDDGNYFAYGGTSDRRTVVGRQRKNLQDRIDENFEHMMKGGKVSSNGTAQLWNNNNYFAAMLDSQYHLASIPETELMRRLTRDWKEIYGKKHRPDHLLKAMQTMRTHVRASWPEIDPTFGTISEDQHKSIPFSRKMHKSMSGTVNANRSQSWCWVDPPKRKAARGRAESEDAETSGRSKRLKVSAAQDDTPPMHSRPANAYLTRSRERGMPEAKSPTMLLHETTVPAAQTPARPRDVDAIPVAINGEMEPWERELWIRTQQVFRNEVEQKRNRITKMEEELQAHETAILDLKRRIAQEKAPA